MKKTLVSVSGSAPSKMAQASSGCLHTGTSVAEEGEEVLVYVCFEEPQPCATCAWGRSWGEDGCCFSSKSQCESRHIML